MSQAPSYEELAFPVLLGAARRTYGAAIRRALIAAGFDDMPRAGASLVARVEWASANARDVAAEHGISKQAVSQLVDTLVTRGYVERIPDETDRRRVTLALTERGTAAAREIRAAVAGVDAALAREAGSDELARTRATLAAAAALGRDDRDSGSGRPAGPAAPREEPKAPTLGNGKICYVEIPAVDVNGSVAFYERVFGWHTRTRGDGSTAFDDGVGEVSGTWVTGRPPSRDPGLLLYVMVDSVAATVEAVVANGGELVQPVGADAPEITARFRDPGGNVIGLYQEPGRAASGAGSG